MRFVTEETDFEVAATISAIHKNPESWEDWRCMRLEMLAQGKKTYEQPVEASVKRILEIYLQGKHGTAFINETSSVDIFVKDTSQSLLETMGRQIVDLLKSETGIASLFRLYDLPQDSVALLDSHRQRKMHVAEPLVQKKMYERTSDNLSLVNSVKVLLVEDDPVTRWMVKMALRDECRLTVAPDAGRALDAYRHGKPDLVLLDINLPGRNGYEVMARIMQADPGANIVMFSSHDSLENLVDSMAMGAKGFIPKPFERERLIRCVRSNNNRM